MLLERRLVSRKTPLDGRLEITAESAAQLAALGTEFAVASAGGEAPGTLHTLTSGCCTCGRERAGAHVHHFVESSLLRALPAGFEVQVELDVARSLVRVEPA